MCHKKTTQSILQFISRQIYYWPLCNFASLQQISFEAENFLRQHEDNHSPTAVTATESSSISGRDKELVVRQGEFRLIKELELCNEFKMWVERSTSISTTYLTAIFYRHWPLLNKENNNFRAVLACLAEGNQAQQTNYWS